jgi:hypothetical protein
MLFDKPGMYAQAIPPVVTPGGNLLYPAPVRLPHARNHQPGHTSLAGSLPDLLATTVKNRKVEVAMGIDQLHDSSADLAPGQCSRVLWN